MKTILSITILLLLINFSYSQEVPKTEILFKTEDSSYIPIYQVTEEEYINLSGHINNSYSRIYGNKRKQTFLLNAPNSYQFEDKKGMVLQLYKNGIYSKQFTIYPDGNKQSWMLKPVGDNFNKGAATLLVGIGSTFVSTLLYFWVQIEEMEHKSELQKNEIIPGSSDNPKYNGPNKMIPYVSLGISISAIVVGIKTMKKNMPSAKRLY